MAFDRKEYYQKNKARYAELMRAWYQKNKEYIKSYQKQRIAQIKADPEKNEKRKAHMKEYTKQYRLKLRDLGIEKMLHYAHKYFKKSHCAVCKTIEKLELHHTRYTHKKEDLLCLCKQHHESFHSNPQIELPFIDGSFIEIPHKKHSKYTKNVSKIGI